MLDKQRFLVCDLCHVSLRVDSSRYSQELTNGVAIVRSIGAGPYRMSRYPHTADFHLCHTCLGHLDAMLRRDDIPNRIPDPEAGPTSDRHIQLGADSRK